MNNSISSLRNHARHCPGGTFTAIMMTLFLVLGWRFQAESGWFQQQYIRVALEGEAQGTTWHLTYYATDSLVHKDQVDSILRVIDHSVSIYNPHSEIVAFNRSKKGILIGEHFYNVIKKSLYTYYQSGGISDITVFPLVQAWGFGVSPVDSYPDASRIAGIMHCVGEKYLRLEGHFLRKLIPCIKIDVNSIAQGYSVDVLAKFLESSGITNYIVEIGGELRVHGRKQPGSEKFRVAIEAPSENDFSATQAEKILLLDSGAVTTSGVYRKYKEFRGKRISHLIDTRTGYPVQNNLISATVYAKDAVTADAFDNVLMVMGLSRAMDFVSRRNMEAFFIYRTPLGEIRDTATSGLYKFIQN